MIFSQHVFEKNILTPIGSVSSSLDTSVWLRTLFLISPQKVFPFSLFFRLLIVVKNSSIYKTSSPQSKIVALPCQLFTTARHTYSHTKIKPRNSHRIYTNMPRNQTVLMMEFLNLSLSVSMTVCVSVTQSILLLLHNSSILLFR